MKLLIARLALVTVLLFMVGVMGIYYFTEPQRLMQLNRGW